MRLFKVKVLNSPRKENDPMYKGRLWGPVAWGHDEFTSWFGVNLPWVPFPSSWARKFEVFDRDVIQEGFYGFLHAHP